ncbi:hypothetical protein LR48_Vigan03g276800 [Vigna angularis]|uniref:Uncharacterized protein n=2 Tax=Phaseolus angularis TaxID=3914 RepID=A0A0L9U9I4_PHAAN|nr:hypothetical protein LR48_Vigan03g276800 [Vigna angularis]BAT86239.1 hypothetical protein VIGAN_04387200 [Vigna angularis var. angularis]
MSNSMHVSALVVFAVLLLSPFVNSGMVYEPDFNYDPIRKTLLIWMEKDMGEETDRLSFVSNFEKGEVELVAGEPYKKYKNYEPKKASLKKGNGKFCVDIDVYDPKVAGGNKRTFWSMRTDAIYHSWDNEIWEKKHDWGNCSF